MQEQDLYTVLGVKDGSSPEEVKLAFREKAKKLHPDQGGDPLEFQKLKDAYDILSDPLSNRHYAFTREVLANELKIAVNQKISELMDRMVNDLYEKGERNAKLIERTIAVLRNSTPSVANARRKLSERLKYYKVVKDRFSPSVEANKVPIETVSQFIYSTEKELHLLDVADRINELTEQKLRSMEYTIDENSEEVFQAGNPYHR